jgi:hypothetical protein
MEDLRCLVWMEKVIAITGASSGIGEATAKLLAASGARVVLGLICASTGLKLLPLRSDKVMLEGAVDGVYGDRKQGILGRSPEPLASHKCCAHGRRKMPTYFTTVEGRLTIDQKSRIAGEITRIHCEVTGAPSFFAQVHFPGGEAWELLHGRRTAETRSDFRLRAYQKRAC